MSVPSPVEQAWTSKESESRVQLLAASGVFVSIRHNMGGSGRLGKQGRAAPAGDDVGQWGIVTRRPATASTRPASVSSMAKATKAACAPGVNRASKAPPFTWQ